MISKIKDPISSLTHLIGVILSIAGLILMVVYSVKLATVWHIVSLSIFGVSLILLYLASTLYHTIDISQEVNRLLRKIDHMMIYILIAGTYTPICLIPLRGIWGWSLLISIWSIALGGIVLKIFWMGAPRWLSTLIYTLMGWLVVIAFVPIYKAISLGGIVWMVLGGVFYTMGAVIYGVKWPKVDNKYFGFHEIFHIFVLLGSFCHFWLMFRYILHVK